jgi:hypothetical protein
MAHSTLILVVPAARDASRRERSEQAHPTQPAPHIHGFPLPLSTEFASAPG